MNRLFLAAALLFLVANASGAYRLVPYQYGTIQDAIDAADTGDIIIVMPDNYYENIVFPGIDTPPFFH